MQFQLRHDVENLTAPGTRRVGSRGHELARNYLVQRMEKTGLSPYSGKSYELPYTVDDQKFINLAGVLPGKNPDLDPLLLVAHYDTCGDQPGADDNAAAIAIWFSLIDLLKANALERSLIFLFPDAEEPPYFLSVQMGSTNFYQHQRKTHLHAGLVLDLVGHDVPMKGMEDLIFLFGAESHPELAKVLREVIPPKGLRNIATLNRYIGDLSDHHILRENDEPYLFFTCGRWQHYHQGSDKPEHLNYEKMERIAHYLYELIQCIAATDLSDYAGPYDPVDMEITLIKRALGEYLDAHKLRMENRSDIQKLVLNWVSDHKL